MFQTIVSSIHLIHIIIHFKREGERKKEGERGNYRGGGKKIDILTNIHP